VLFTEDLCILYCR